VQTLTNVTADDGTIGAFWNMLDTNGVARTNADADPEFSAIVTVYDAPVSHSTPPKKHRKTNWPGHGAWTVSFQDFFKFEYSQNDYMHQVINMYANTAAKYGGYYLYYPLPGQTNDIGQTYPIRYQKKNHYDTNITSDKILSDNAFLLSYLTNTTSRNFFFDGHGGPNYIASLSSVVLKAYIHHRYRFVMLDACSTAVGDLDDAFGIHGPGTFDIGYYENAGIRPAAFCGYDYDVPYEDSSPVNKDGVDYDDTVPNDVPFFISNFLFYWDTYIQTLQQSINLAGQNLPDPGGYQGRENHWKIYGFPDLKIDAYNYAGSTW
jgi:hypothetical protein